MNRTIISWGALLAGMAVALGAFGAHGLEGKISADSIQTFKTGVSYQFYHALALLIVGALSDRLSPKASSWLGWFFGLGILCFSGSLYLLSTRAITGWDVSFLGPVTPIGGVLFIIGWLLFSMHALRMRR
ncbi:MAG: DUF423 domain-containing protein [Bacteroidetes bacterium]|nr:DUF423 domain-containing protein [Bacteroidota bacterium]